MTLGEHCLQRLTHGNARPVRRWKIVAHYEQLVAQGLASEIETDNPFIREFAITKAGRAACANITYAPRNRHGKG